MHGNASVPGASFPGADARDIDAWLTGGVFQNIWIGNDCDTGRNDLRRRIAQPRKALAGLRRRSGKLTGRLLPAGSGAALRPPMRCSRAM